MNAIFHRASDTEIRVTLRGRSVRLDPAELTAAVLAVTHGLVNAEEMLAALDDPESTRMIRMPGLQAQKPMFGPGASVQIPAEEAP